MRNLHVRVLEVRTDIPSSWPNKLLMVVTSTQDTSGPEVTVDDSGYVKSCNRVWTFIFREEQMAEMQTDVKKVPVFQVILRRRRIFGKNTTIGNLTLPICWFPLNKVVREWFPMKTNGQDVMVLLDVHVNADNSEAFEAPFSQMEVVPAWSRPIDRYAPYQPPPKIIILCVPQVSPPASQAYPSAQPSMACPSFLAPQEPIGCPSFAVPPGSMEVPQYGTTPPSSNGIGTYGIPPTKIPSIPVFPYGDMSQGGMMAGPGMMTGAFPVLQDSSGYPENGRFVPQYVVSDGFAPPVQSIECPTVSIQMFPDAF